jgi:hypothetical protein
VKRYIYMNEFVKERYSSKPKIVIQEGDKITYVNVVHLSGDFMVKTGYLEEAPEHDVHAWIEAKPTASVWGR